MTSNVISKYDDLVYYKPKELIAFYRSTCIYPHVNALIATFVRYRYEAAEMYQVCKAFGVSDQDYREIRNKVYDKINPLAQAREGSRSITDERLDAAWQHINELHYRNLNYGHIIFGTPKPARYAGDKNSMWQLAINKKDLTRDVVAKLLTVSNLYIMVNTSKSFARKTTDIGNINALYLDIDNVKDPAAYIAKCVKEGRFDKLEPSRIIVSGGGLHIYFYLDNAYANDKLNPYVKRIQKALHEIYPEADKLSDLVRFLRLEGSLYDKPNKALKVVESVFESKKVYTVGEIGPMLVPVYESKDKPKKTKIYSFSKMSDGKSKLSKVPGTWRDLEVNRLRDIEYLASIGHFDVERRKRAVFFYALFAFRATKSFSEAATAAHGFNTALKSPLSVDVVENQICSIAENGKAWTYKRETVVAQLEIDDKHLDDTQIANLQALCPTGEKRQRDYETRKKSRRNEKNLTKREASKEEKIQTIKTLLEQGYKQVEIVKETGYSKSYVSEIVKQIKSEGK